MIKTKTRAALAALALTAASAALAHGYKAGNIAIGNPWARATAPRALNGAGYLTLTNNGKFDDRLLGGSTPVAKGFELHESSMTGGIMRMRRLDKGLTIHPGETVRIAPGGTHLMLTGLRQPLAAGTTVPATLRFERAGPVDIAFKVQALAAAAPDHGAMDHGK